MDVVVSTLAERPEAEPLLWDLSDEWPQFMAHDPVADLYYPDCDVAFPEFVLLAWDRAEPDRLLARGFAVPFALGGDTGREGLPDRGWDQVIQWGYADRLRGRRTTHVSALEIVIAARARGAGLSGLMLARMRDNAARLGYADLVAPVRPSGKAAVPHTTMADYLARTRPDGLPEDPWLRVHVRAGGEVVGVAPASMTVTGTLAQWREWTGMAFDTPGEVVVPGALLPLHCEPAHDFAVYVEPNVWVHHRLAPVEETEESR
jgi:GNAT superfamily N-acetyltransferase